MPEPRASILRRFREKIARGEPTIGGGAGTGLSAKGAPLKLEKSDREFVNRYGCYGGSGGGSQGRGFIGGSRSIPGYAGSGWALFGDSNTDGAGFQWYKDDWRSDRAWHFSGAQKKWLPAQPGIPHSMDSKLNPPWGSVGFPFVKKLAQTYPDYCFGIVKATHGGSPFGFGDYDKYLGLLLQHGGQFIAQGAILEGWQFDKRLYERLCKDFNNTLDRFATGEGGGMVDVVQQRQKAAPHLHAILRRPIAERLAMVRAGPNGP